MAKEMSPLLHVEHGAQVQAKHEHLDLARPDDQHRLAELVAAEIEQWNAEHRLGRRPYALIDAEAIAARAMSNLAGYGPLSTLLADDDVWEIMVNAPDAIFVKRHRGPSGLHGEVFHDDDHVRRTLTKMLAEASSSHRKLDPAEGLQDAQLDGGARVHIVHGDLARGGHLIVNIRKFTGVAIRRLDELVDRGTVTGPVARFLAACVRARLSIVFAGAPGSGKTTLMSCCTAELDPALRVVIAEEVFEADIPLPNVAQLQTRAARTDRPAVDLRRLVSGFLRMSPDVAIVGEVRDHEALPLLLTLSSGVKGYTTIHAGSARQALTRLRFLCQLSDINSDIPMSALNHLVTEAVDLVVHSQRATNGTAIEVTNIIGVEELTGGTEANQLTVTDIVHREARGEPLRWTGLVPVRVQRRLSDAGEDVQRLLRDMAGAR
jgi:pilus assembly protein CpaF